MSGCLLFAVWVFVAHSVDTLGAPAWNVEGIAALGLLRIHSLWMTLTSVHKGAATLTQDGDATSGVPECCTSTTVLVLCAKSFRLRRHNFSTMPQLGIAQSSLCRY